AKKPRYEYNLVRVDASQSKITTFMAKSQPETPIGSQIPRSSNANQEQEEEDDDDDEEEEQDTNEDEIHEERHADLPNHNQTQLQYMTNTKELTTINLKSILDLRGKLQTYHSKPLTELFANLTYIGIIDSTRRLCSVQYDVKLLIIDYGSVTNELFYQLGLLNFGNFGTIELQGTDEELSIESLLSVLYKDPNFKPSKSIKEVEQCILEMSEMYREYFQIQFTESGIIKTIPILLKNYMPPLEKLPMFLYRLSTQVSYDDEQCCLDGILRQLALFHIPLSLNEDDDSKVNELNGKLENVLIPQIKRVLVAPNWLKKDVVEVADLPGLYRVFERC
ncbi:hypothetical protein WICPIJ_006137, partial [Wickerhamomyces pijperi]